MQDLLTVAATAVEIAIVALPAIRLVSRLMPRRAAILDYPGEFAPLPVEAEADPELDDWVTQPTELPVPVVEPDPWETVEVEPVAIAQVAPLHPAVPYLLSLPPAREQQPDWATLTPEQLRKACQQAGIQWRNAHGKGKHLRKGEMVAALAAA